MLANVTYFSVFVIKACATSREMSSPKVVSEVEREMSLAEIVFSFFALTHNSIHYYQCYVMLYVKFIFIALLV